jgi:hypothetical protein
MKELPMTSQFRRLPLPDLFSQSRGHARRSDTEWESVMVQITLAFVIILGYLLSQGMADSRQLADEVATQKMQNTQLSQIISAFAQTDAGREREQRIAVQRENRFLNLLNRWLRVKDDQRFHTLAQMFSDATLVQLSDDLHSLPVDATFQELNAEVARLFPYEKGAVASAELDALLTQVLSAEGGSLQPNPDLERMRKENPQAFRFLDASGAFTAEEIDALRKHITGDMSDERAKFVRIQLALIEKIFSTRLQKLADLPLDDQLPPELELEGQNLGRRMLERILSDLRADVQLLEEAEEQLRESDSAATNAEETNSEATNAEDTL